MLAKARAIVRGESQNSIIAIAIRRLLIASESADEFRCDLRSFWSYSGLDIDYEQSTYREPMYTGVLLIAKLQLV